MLRFTSLLCVLRWPCLYLNTQRRIHSHAYTHMWPPKWDAHLFFGCFFFFLLRDDVWSHAIFIAFLCGQFFLRRIGNYLFATVFILALFCSLCPTPSMNLFSIWFSLLCSLPLRPFNSCCCCCCHCCCWCWKCCYFGIVEHTEQTHTHTNTFEWQTKINRVCSLCLLAGWLLACLFACLLTLFHFGKPSCRWCRIPIFSSILHFVAWTSSQNSATAAAAAGGGGGDDSVVSY